MVGEENYLGEMCDFSQYPLTLGICQFAVYLKALSAEGVQDGSFALHMECSLLLMVMAEGHKCFFSMPEGRDCPGCILF